MGVIKGALREELRNSLQMKRDYERELSRLPRGSLIRKRIRGHEYYYLVYREDGRVKQEYRGKVGEAEVQRYREAKEYRARYRRLLSQVKKQIKFLRSALRGKESV